MTQREIEVRTMEWRAKAEVIEVQTAKGKEMNASYAQKLCLTTFFIEQLLKSHLHPSKNPFHDRRFLLHSS